YRQPEAVHLMAHVLNSALGNIGKTVLFHEVLDLKEGSLSELAQALKGDQVQTLVIIGVNPVYTAPADLDWLNTQKKAKTVIRLGYYEEEPSQKFLHDGFLSGSAAKTADVQLNATTLAKGTTPGKAAAAKNKDNLEVVFHRDYSVDDGRYNNNGWLQEMPDPITKMVWDNAVLISRKTAEEFGVKNSDLVEIKLGNRSVKGPIWVQPGLADYSLGLAL